MGIDVHYDDDLTFSLVSLPRNGYLALFVSKASPGASNDFSIFSDGAGSYLAAVCYVPFESTFTGFDSFVYSAQDNRGGQPSFGTVSLEITAN
jgi:hypothetical protein